MIRKTLDSAKKATFCVQLPSQKHQGMPMPTGTGFFISPDGWFVTAAHVVTKNGAANGEKRDDIHQAWLMKEPDEPGPPGSMCQFVTIEHVLPEFDFALLRVDYEKNSNKDWLKNRTDFPYIKVSTRKLDIGEPVYSFGYPLSSGEIQQKGTTFIGSTQLSPRLTSAVVSSSLEKTQMIMTGSDPQKYVLDKALNYGNSGGPILATETGHVHALCSQFQPVFVPQAHMKDKNGQIPAIMIPSLYGVVSSLSNPGIVKLLNDIGVSITDE